MEALMTNRRIWLATICVVLGALQAWDSRALAAEPFVQLLIALAILLVPAAVAATERTPVHLAAAISAAAALAIARLISTAHMPALMLAAVFPAVLVLMAHARERASQQPH
jgi:hypothetical protein